MSITINPDLEAKLRLRAEAEGITVDHYVEAILRSVEQADEEIEALALEGLNSGEPIDPGPSYWEDKHRHLDERLRSIGAR